MPAEKTTETVDLSEFMSRCLMLAEADECRRDAATAAEPVRGSLLARAELLRAFATDARGR